MGIIADFDVVDFWVDDDDVWVAVIFLHFCMAVSESAADRKTAWNDAHRTLSDRSSWACQHDVIVLVNLPSSFQNSLPFWFFRWFVVVGNRCELLPTVGGQDCSGIASVSYPHVIIDDEHDNGTGT